MQWRARRPRDKAPKREAGQEKTEWLVRIGLVLSLTRKESPHICMISNTTFFVLVGAALVALSSCASPPAKIRQVDYDVVRGESSEARLHRMLDRSVRHPDAEDADKVIGSMMELWNTQGLGENHLVPSPDASRPSYRVTYASPRLGCYAPDYFDQLHSAANLEVSKIPHYRKPGVGAPLVAIRENRQRDALERFYPPEAITRPLTATVTAGRQLGDVQDLEIALLCPLTHPRVDGGELAADYSAPWATFLSRTDKLSRRNFLDALTPEPKRDPQLYLMEPYNPDKEPLLMIHGLFSTPLTWAELSNEMWADDAIRDRYQVWHYLYNTSAPPLYSARILRTQLRDLKAMLDPAGRHHAWKNLTIVAHSMGGIVTKCLVTRPGNAYWDAAFTVPHETLKLSAEDRAALDEAFEWQPIPNVKRIIFVAVPHRGSDFADNAVGRLGRFLTRTPNSFKAFYERISQANPGAFTPEYAALGEGKMDSISVLSPRQPTLKILSKLPFAYPVEKYSIIGDRGKPGALEDSSDGVVPYWSSHIDGVLSEKVVPTDHGAFHYPEGIAEIKRVLKLR